MTMGLNTETDEVFRSEPFYALRGGQSGPVLRVLGSRADLSGVVEGLNAHDTAAELAGTLEFYARSSDDMRAPDLPGANSDDQVICLVSGSYREIVERACDLGMFPARPAQFHSPGNYAAGPITRKTGANWKKRQW